MNLEQKTLKAINLLRTQKFSLITLAANIGLNKEKAQAVLKDIEKSGYALKLEKHKGSVIYYIRTLEEGASHCILSPRSSHAQRIVQLYLADFHAGSKQFAKEALRTTLKLGWEYGARHCFIAGDLVDGVNVYRGQLVNLHHWKIEEQAEDAAEILREFHYDYYACDGNHDESWIKLGATSPVSIIASKVPNFKYLPGVEADIVIEGVLLRMVHGAGASAYAISYPIQKYLRNFYEQGNLKVQIGDILYDLQILLYGHSHRSMGFEIYGVEAIAPGNFQYPNSFTIRSGLIGPQGGWIVDLTTGDGKIIDFTTKKIKLRR